MKKHPNKKRPFSPSYTSRYIVTLHMHDFSAHNITVLFEELINNGSLLGFLCTPSYRHTLEAVNGYTPMEEHYDLSYLYPDEREPIYMVGNIGEVVVNEIATKKEILYKRRKGLRYQAAKFILLYKQGETVALQIMDTKPMRGELK